MPFCEIHPRPELILGVFDMLRRKKLGGAVFPLAWNCFSQRRCEVVETNVTPFVSLRQQNFQGFRCNYMPQFCKIISQNLYKLFDGMVSSKQKSRRGGYQIPHAKNVPEKTFQKKIFHHVRVYLESMDQTKIYNGIQVSGWAFAQLMQSTQDKAKASGSVGSAGASTNQDLGRSQPPTSNNRKGCARIFEKTDDRTYLIIHFRSFQGLGRTGRGFTPKMLQAASPHLGCLCRRTAAPIAAHA